jgi:carbon monoxide dehydrogenase subunit G
LCKVDLGFIGAAGKTYVAECDLEAARADVWAAFVDPSTWSSWWPGVASASYRGSSPPYGVGTFREARVGGQRYEEYIVVWEEGRRWGYYIDRASVPIATAQLECTEFEDHGSGTRVRWTLAQDPRLLMRLIGPFFPRIMQGLLKKAMANLDRHIVASKAAGGGA